MRDAFQIFPELSLFFRDLLGYYDIHDDEEITFRVGLSVRKAAAAHTRLLAAIGAGRDFYRYSILKRRDHDLCAEDRIPRRKVKPIIKVSAPDSEVGMSGKTDSQVEIARRCPANSFVPHSRDANDLSVGYSRWNFYFDRL